MLDTATTIPNRDKERDMNLLTHTAHTRQRLDGRYLTTITHPDGTTTTAYHDSRLEAARWAHDQLMALNHGVDL